MPTSYYDILGVSKEASQDEIKVAYRNKAKETHPDINSDPGAEDMFKQVSEAYSVLSDENKRAEYDARTSGVFPGFGFPGGFPGFPGGIPQGFEDFFVSAASGHHRKNAPRKGSTVSIERTLSLYEALIGTTFKATVNFSARCDSCGGSGGLTMDKCTRCNGAGNIYTQQGTMRFGTTCNYCHGAGETPRDVCPTCNRTGRKEYSRDISVDVPAGFSGGNIVVPGLGAPGIKGGPPGDIVVEFNIKLVKLNSNELSEEELSVLRKLLS